MRGAPDLAPDLSFSPSGAADPDPHARSHVGLYKRWTLDSFIASFTAAQRTGWLNDEAASSDAGLQTSGKPRYQEASGALVADRHRAARERRRIERVTGRR